MMKIRIFCWMVISGLLFMAFGCAGVSPSSTYYLLGIPDSPGPACSIVENSLSVGVGPVTIPGHLDRPEIVTRTGRNTIAVNEFHRWGDSLTNQFKNSLVMNLSALLKTPGVVLYPWERAITPEYQVIVRVLRFEDGGQGAELDALWQVKDTKTDKSILARRFSVVIPFDGSGLDAYVTAQTTSVEGLCRDIAKGICTLASGQQPSDN